MDITEVMKVVTTAMNITEPLLPEDEGRYRLVFDDKFNIDFSITRKGDLIIAGELKKFSQKILPREDYLVKVMAASTELFHHEQDCISYDLDTNRIIIYRRLNRSDITAKNILESLEGLLNNMEIWVSTFSEEKGGSYPSSQSIFLTP